MPLIPVHDLPPDHGSIPVYNGNDSCSTYELNTVLKREFGGQEKLIYEFELGMQAPALEMMLRGFRVDPWERERALSATKHKHGAAMNVLRKLVEAVYPEPYEPRLAKGRWTLPNSNTQLQHLFYSRLGLMPLKTHFGGVERTPMDRKILERLEDHFYARPFVNAILLIRDLEGIQQVLETEIDSDWRWRCSYNIGGTSTGRWSSSKSGTGMGCVLPWAEAFTPDGWKRVDGLRNDDIILQWEPKTNSLEWRHCQMFTKDFTGEMLQVKTEQIKQTLTPDHRVVRYDSRMSWLYTEPAREVAKLSQEVIPLGAKFEGGTEEIPRFAAMLMADFSQENYGWRGMFKKQRKIDRFLLLAAEYGIEFEEQQAKEDYRRFAIRGYKSLPKKWGPWILDLTPESAEELLEEARYWDATDRGSGFIFFTADEEQASWFATLAHLTGRAATMRLVQQNTGSYSDTPMWWVNVKTRGHARVQKKHWSKAFYVGKVYCPSVPSSYWLMREDNFISITGNSNFQNITDELRRVFIADEGWRLCGIDLEQAESREVGWFCGVTFGDWSYLDMVESGDPHTFVARMCWPDLDWTGDLKKDRKIAERKFYRHFTYRDATKRLGHGSNYCGKPPTMSSHTKIPLNIVRPFQERYFDAFPCIPRMHHWVARELQTQGFLVNAFGRRRDFFGRPKDDETLKGAVAYLFQSATGDRLNLGLWRVWKHMGTRVQLLAQLHDALYFQYRLDDKENEVIQQAMELMQIPLYHEGRKFVVPGEATTGFNWAHRFRLLEDGTLQDWNPKGLDKWKGA